MKINKLHFLFFGFCIIHLTSFAGEMEKKGKMFVSNNGTYEILLTDIENFKIGTFNQTEIKLKCLLRTDCTIKKIQVSASMPHHGHGLKYNPEVVRLGPLNFKVLGLKFHMEGYWELYLDIQGEKDIERGQLSIRI